LSLKNRDTDEVIITVVEAKDNAIFVSYDIGDDSNNGSPDAPVQTRAIFTQKNNHWWERRKELNFNPTNQPCAAEQSLP